MMNDKDSKDHPYDALWKARDLLVSSLNHKFNSDYGLIERLREAYDKYEMDRYYVMDDEHSNGRNVDVVLLKIDADFIKQHGILNVARDMVARCESACRNYCEEFTRVRKYEIEFLKGVLQESKQREKEKENELKSIIDTREAELTFYSMKWLETDIVGDVESRFLVLFVELLLSVGCR